MAKDNHNEIYEHPDAEASHGEEHENTRDDFANVESMDSENPKEVAKECGCRKTLRALFDLTASCHSDKITTCINT